MPCVPPIITAGSLIGLGLAAVGVGMRYQAAGLSPSTDGFVHWRQLDTPMMLILVLLILTLLAGLAATFLGLAYHHERRHFERQAHLSGTSKLDSLRN